MSKEDVPSRDPQKGYSADGKSPPTALDNVEQLAKIFATAAIPVIVALGGWAIQTTIEKDKERAAEIQRRQQSALDKDKISLEYVKLAKDILTSSEKGIPLELTKWSWQLIDGVSPVKFDPEDLRKLIARNDRIPASPSLSTNYSSLAPEYDQMFNNMTLTVALPMLDSVIDRISANKPRYVPIEKATGVPWFVIGIMHYLDTSLDFSAGLNGDPIGSVTTHVPKGRGPFSSWEDSVQDTLKVEGLINAQDWTVLRMLYRIEGHNGFGYRTHQINSPYLWNCTSQYTKGQYTSENKFDPESKATICGAAVLLKRMIDRHLINQQMSSGLEKAN